MKDDGLEGIGQRIREIRIAEGLTQEEFAKVTNLTQSAISQFEEERRVPSLSSLAKIAAGLGTTIGEVIDETPKLDSEDPEKDDAIRTLVRRLRSESYSARAIVALSRFVRDFETI